MWLRHGFTTFGMPGSHCALPQGYQLSVNLATVRKICNFYICPCMSVNDMQSADRCKIYGFYKLHKCTDSWQPCPLKSDPPLIFVQSVGKEFHSRKQFLRAYAGSKSLYKIFMPRFPAYIPNVPNLLGCKLIPFA